MASRIQYFAQKAFVCHEEQLLLVEKAASDPHNPGKWEVPGGRMDFGEAVDEHIKREVREEVGISVAPGDPFFIWQWVLQARDSADSERREIQIVAVARICKPLTLEFDYGGRVPEDHLGSAVWVPFEEVASYPLIENMYPVVQEFWKRVRT